MGLEKSCLDCRFAEWDGSGEKEAGGYCRWASDKRYPACLTMPIDKNNAHVDCPAWEDEERLTHDCNLKPYRPGEGPVVHRKKNEGDATPNT